MARSTVAAERTSACAPPRPGRRWTSAIARRCRGEGKDERLVDPRNRGLPRCRPRSCGCARERGLDRHDRERCRQVTITPAGTLVRLPAALAAFVTAVGMLIVVRAVCDSPVPATVRGVVRLAWRSERSLTERDQRDEGEYAHAGRHACRALPPVSDGGRRPRPRRTGGADGDSGTTLGAHV